MLKKSVQLLSMFLLFLSSIAMSNEMSPCYQAGLEENDQLVLSICQDLVSESDAHAQYLMALANVNLHTQFGNKAKKSQNKLRNFKLSTEEKIAIQDAKFLLEDAVESGHVGAHFLLGYLIKSTLFSLPEFNGNVNKTHEKAIKLLTIAADEGNEGAKMLLAEYAVSYNVEGHVVNVAKEYRKYLEFSARKYPELYGQLLVDFVSFSNRSERLARNQESATAAELASEGIRLSFSENNDEFQQGIAMLKKAADKGAASASFRLASLYKHKDINIALKYFTQAADSHKGAAMWLGEYYGCKGNKDSAMKWLDKAKTLGNKNAQDAIDEISEYGDLATCPS